jgi:hypothetical protein
VCMSRKQHLLKQKGLLKRASCSNVIMDGSWVSNAPFGLAGTFWDRDDVDSTPTVWAQCGVTDRASHQHMLSVWIRSRVCHVQDSDPCGSRRPALNIKKKILISKGIVLKFTVKDQRYYITHAFIQNHHHGTQLRGCTLPRLAIVYMK